MTSKSCLISFCANISRWEHLRQHLMSNQLNDAPGICCQHQLMEGSGAKRRDSDETNKINISYETYFRDYLFRFRGGRRRKASAAHR